MKSLSLINISKADRLDENLMAARYDIIGQVNCTLYLYVRNMFTIHRYQSLQALEIKRVKNLLSQKLYIDFDKDAKALYIDKHYVETLMDFARNNPVDYTTGWLFLAELTRSIYQHLFTQDERAWIADKEYAHRSKVMYA